MSDHDTFDIDRAFDDLIGDVGTVSAAPGARRAIGTSRRRRVGVVGLAVAGLATAGGLALSGLPGGDQAGPPVTDGVDEPADPPTDPVDPRPLTAEVLESATIPWLEGWIEADSPVLTDAPCVGENLPEPDAVESSQFRAGTDVGAERIYSRWASPGRAARIADRINDSLAGCALEGRTAGGPTPPNIVLETATPGVTVTFHEGPDGERRVTWVAERGRRVALLTIAGGGAPPAVVQEQVGDVLVAAMSFDEAD